MVTDPPYGVEYEPNWRNNALRPDGSRLSARAIGKPRNDDRINWAEAWALFPGDVAFVWHAGRYASEVAGSLATANFEIRSQIIWAKTHLVISRGDYHWQHEPCWYVVRKGRPGHFCGDRSQTTLWEINNPTIETDHSNQKPIECMARPMRNHTAFGECIYDPFLGSGTSLIAAQQLNRICYGIELEPMYVAVALERFQESFGIKPERAS